METMDKEVYEIKKDGMTRAERRAYKVCWRNKRIKKRNNESFLNISDWRKSREAA